MPLGNPLSRLIPPDALIGMNIDASVFPSSSPRRLADEQAMRSPVETAYAPSPGPEESSESYTVAKVDRSAHKKSRPRRNEYYAGVVVRHRNIIWIYRSDRDVRSAAHYDLRVASQIPEVSGFPAFSLHRIHHVLLLRQKSISDLAGPIHVRSHHFKDGWEG